MSLTLEPQVLPLKSDADGTVRVSGTRVTLDTLIYFYQQGHTAEQLHDGFPGVPLADAHAVIAYYLRHKDKVDGYLAERLRTAEQRRQEFEAQHPPRPIRPELLSKLRGARERNEQSSPESPRAEPSQA